jgi:DNA topoisomerase-1
VQQYLTGEQLKLYILIWQRMVASQMAAAQIATTTVDIEATARNGKVYLLRATSSTIDFPGFLIVYQESRDEDEEERKNTLSRLTEGELLRLLKLTPRQHFTQPPARYTEATLVKALEELGIGRPSTYATIIFLIQDRGYVDRKNGKLTPTELGTVVSGLLSEHFAEIVNAGFTAQMEEKLDLIASGKLKTEPMLREFYDPFQETVSRAFTAIPKISEPTEEICEQCGAPMVVKWGRAGKFLSCSTFPKCKNAKPIVTNIGLACPKCGGDIVERRTRRGKIFYDCSKYPNCDFASWEKPLRPCPECSGLLVLTKKEMAKCMQCDYEIPADD